MRRHLANSFHPSLISVLPDRVRLFNDLYKYDSSPKPAAILFDEEEVKLQWDKSIDFMVSYFPNNENRDFQEESSRFVIEERLSV